MTTQFMADFLAEFAGNDHTTLDWWSLYVNGALNMREKGAIIILEGANNVTLKQALKLNFKASNNQAKCEALIAGLKLAKEVGTKKLRCYTNS